MDGYVDDGREIFDEADEDEEDGAPAGPSKRKRNSNIRKPGQTSADQVAAKSKQRQFMSQFLATKTDTKKAAKEVMVLAILHVRDFVGKQRERHFRSHYKLSAFFCSFRMRR